MSNLVLAEAGALAAGQELALVRFGSTTEEPVRGTFARLPETVSDVVAAWSKGGFHAWLTGVRMPKDAEFLAVTGQGPDAGRYRVIYHERIVGAFVTDHYQLQPEPMP